MLNSLYFYENNMIYKQKNMNAKIFVTNYTFDNQLKRKETLILLY